MASFTSVGDTTSLSLTFRGDVASVALSGTYSMTIALQREVGSPGSGAWQTLKEWSTADATVAYDHAAEEDDENLRLIVLVDTSGTCTATLTDTASVLFPGSVVKDPDGLPIMRTDEDGVRFYKGVRLGEPVLITAALTLDVDKHGERLLVFDVAAGVTVTLPAATGSGVKFRFFVGVTVTSSNDVIQVANANDTMKGTIVTSADGGDTTVGWEAASTSDTITLNGSTKGGILGDYIEVEDALPNVWRVTGQTQATGTEVTPFSAAVS